MKTDINGVPAAFFGFNGHEEEIDEIKKAIECHIFIGMLSLDGWNAIADAFEQSGVSNVIFNVDDGICFVRVADKKDIDTRAQDIATFGNMTIDEAKVVLGIKGQSISVAESFGVKID